MPPPAPTPQVTLRLAQAEHHSASTCSPPRRNQSQRRKSSRCIPRRGWAICAPVTSGPMRSTRTKTWAATCSRAPSASTAASTVRCVHLTLGVDVEGFGQMGWADLSKRRRPVRPRRQRAALRSCWLHRYRLCVRPSCQVSAQVISENCMLTFSTKACSKSIKFTAHSRRRQVCYCEI